LLAGEESTGPEKAEEGDDELKGEEEGGERDDRGEPEGPDDELDGDLHGDVQEQDGEYSYEDDQQRSRGEIALFPPYDGGEFQFDPRVDDRYFQHDSDDEVWPDPPKLDELEPEPEGEDEPLRL
jgi:hypothetical protein